MNPGFNDKMDGFDDNADEQDIIDEEELEKIKILKELKKQYRAEFGELRECRQQAAFTQQAIDSAKQTLVAEFEEWYEDNFEDANDLLNSSLPSSGTPHGHSI